MGTSTRMPAGVTGQPNWSKLSSEVTRACDGETTPQPKLKKIIADFVEAAGGSEQVSGGYSKSVGRAGVSTAQRIADFITNASRQGYREALRQTGLENIDNKSSQEVINHLVNYCAKNAATIDDVAARAAAAELFAEFDANLEDIANLDNEQMNEVIIKFFTYYIYEHLSTRFAEKLEQAKSVERCKKLFQEIKDYIFEEIKGIAQRKDLAKINWAGARGEQITKEIFNDILEIYES